MEQTLRELEIIIVDDGSTDGSLAAAEAASQGYANVRVYTKPNEGLSLTRNYGTDRATGRYVMYLDADDYLEPNVLGRLATIMERERLDLLCYEIVAVDEQGKERPLWSDGSRRRTARKYRPDTIFSAATASCRWFPSICTTGSCSIPTSSV